MYINCTLIEAAVNLLPKVSCACRVYASAILMEQGVEQRVGAAIFIHVGETSIRVADDDQFADRAFGDTAERWRVVESHFALADLCGADLEQ